jgi:cytochrome c5
MFARKCCVALFVLAAMGSGAAQEPAADIITTKCMTCHGDDLIRQQRLTREGWSREVDKMIAWGAAVTAQDRAPLLDALTMAGRSAAPRTPIDPLAAVVLETRCQVCHDLRMIDQQRLDAAGWRREVDRMIAWGAVVTPTEKAALVALLVQRQAGVLPYPPQVK